MPDENVINKIESVRHFNRFYTRQIGLITGHYLGSPFSVTEARVLYELAHLTNPTATLLIAELGLDAGYLSRILRNFIQQGLVVKKRSPKDARQHPLSLTDKGCREFENLNASSQAGIQELLKNLSSADQTRIVNAMQTIESLLGNSSDAKTSSPLIIREPRPGDMGWVVKRHAELYAEEYGWDETFEGLVVEIVAKFVHDFDRDRERCWIAERDRENIGSIFLVKKDEKTAKLRLLIVDPKARGLGLGSKLIEECIRFARDCGYEKMVLWTNSNLFAARHLYQKFGFLLVDMEAHHSYGHDLVGENWELDLR